jgi:hypothetical protein
MQAQSTATGDREMALMSVAPHLIHAHPIKPAEALAALHIVMGRVASAALEAHFVETSPRSKWSDPSDREMALSTAFVKYRQALILLQQVTAISVEDCDRIFYISSWESLLHD